MRRVVGCGALLTAVLLSACDSSLGHEAPGHAVRDSAGVQIVENTPGTWPADREWRLSSEPTLHIGLLDGAPEYQFTRIPSVRRLSDGRLVAADAGTHQIRIYSGSGTHLQTLGGQGDGPGEFQQIGWIEVLSADSLLVFDSRQMRFSIFAPSGAFVGTSPVPTEHGRIMPLGRFADGSMLGSLMTSLGPGAATGPHRSTSTYLRLAPDAASLDTLAVLRGGESYVRALGQGMSVSTLMFGRGSAHAIGGTRLFAGDTDDFTIGVYSVTGTLERLIRVVEDPRPVTEAEVDAERQRRREGLSSSNIPEQMRRGFEQMLADMPVPPTMPAYGRLLADRSGHLWVQDYGLPGTTATGWRVFDPEGRMLGSVTFPVSFRVTEIGSDYVLGVWQDEFEVEHVRMYALVRI